MHKPSDLAGSAPAPAATIPLEAGRLDHPKGSAVSATEFPPVSDALGFTHITVRAVPLVAGAKPVVSLSVAYHGLKVLRALTPAAARAIAAQLLAGADQAEGTAS